MYTNKHTALETKEKKNASLVLFLDERVFAVPSVWLLARTGSTHCAPTTLCDEDRFYFQT